MPAPAEPFGNRRNINALFKRAPRDLDMIVTLFNEDQANFVPVDS
jgi:hypothetical protein